MTAASQTRIASQGLLSSNEIALVDMEALMDCFSAASKPTVLVIMVRLRALKQWIDKQYDVHGPEMEPNWSILEFTPEVCQAIQRTLAKGAKSSQSGGSSDDGHKQEATS